MCNHEIIRNKWQCLVFQTLLNFMVLCAQSHMGQSEELCCWHEVRNPHNPFSVAVIQHLLHHTYESKDMALHIHFLCDGQGLSFQIYLDILQFNCNCTVSYYRKRGFHEYTTLPLFIYVKQKHLGCKKATRPIRSSSKWLLVTKNVDIS